jgi:YVTN family beta-propeller protein
MSSPQWTRRTALVAGLAGVGATLFTVPASASPVVTNVPVGDEPSSVAVDSATGTVYVANRAAGTVSVLDRNNVVVATVPVEGHPTDVAVHEVTGRAYLTSPDTGTVTVVEGGAPAGVVRDLPGASVVDVDPMANLVYAASGTGGSVGVIDGATGTLARTVPGPGQGFAGITVDAGRKRAYLSSVYTASVEVLDTAAFTFTGRLPAGNGATGVAAHVASDTVYVANAAIHHLSVVDAATGTEKPHILLRSASSSVSVHEASNTVYCNGGPNGLVRIDGATSRIVGELPLGINPGVLAVDQRTQTVYLTDPLRDTVSVITGF